MLLLPPELCQRVQALLHGAVHPGTPFAVVNETILELQRLAPAMPPLADAGGPAPPAEESRVG